VFVRSVRAVVPGCLREALPPPHAGWGVRELPYQRETLLHLRFIAAAGRAKRRVCARRATNKTLAFRERNGPCDVKNTADVPREWSSLKRQPRARDDGVRAWRFFRDLTRAKICLGADTAKTGVVRMRGVRFRGWVIGKVRDTTTLQTVPRCAWGENGRVTSKTAGYGAMFPVS
jgi:hypothetical protein